MYREKFMKLAYQEAQKAYKNNEVPIGAVIVNNDEIIAKAYNKKNLQNLVTSHAEILAITKANKKTGNWRLDECDIYITLEPCPMCMSAIQQARIKNVFFGINNADNSNLKIIKKICNATKCNPAVKLNGGYMEDQIKKLMQDFFTKKR